MPETSEAERVVIELTTGDRLVFDNLDEVTAFAEEQTELWSWLQQAAAHHSQLNAPWKQLKNLLTQISAGVKRYRAATEDSQRGQAADQIRSGLTTLVASPHWIQRSDPRAQYLKTLAEGDPGLAGFCYLAFTQPGVVPTSEHKALYGIMHAWMFENALPAGRANSELQSLSAARKDWGDFSGKAKLDFTALRSDLEALRQDLRSLRAEESEDFAKALAEGKNALLAVEKTYDEKLALQQPVKYWSARAERHRNLSIAYAAAFVTAVVAVLCLVGFASTYVVPEFWQPELLANADGTVRELPYWRMAVFALLGGFLVWPVRILPRVLLSNLHLWTDAEERTTMANTYLALLRSEAGLQDGDRKLILETLFRTAATGIVKEDGMAPGATEFWSKVIGGR